MFAWTNRNVEQLQALWKQGLSGAEIAQRIGTGRSAVLAKARRLDLDARKDWPKEREALLSNLWSDDSLTLADIGLILGIGRNAVCGKGHRLGLPPRGHLPERRARLAKDHRQSSRLPAVSKPTPTPIAKPPAVVPAGRPVPLVDLERHHCRWIRDDGLFCGTAKARGSYCATHAAITYRVEEPRMPKRAA